ncbi:MFS transporter, partial [Cryobacterium sp. MLB-32]|uniref:MFS transporter n=1 Tax=Cryobacterium sp. MLB-32 TaxID=1529318 RepID=UPI0012E08F89
VAVLLLGISSIWALYCVAFLVGVSETIYDTSAQSILPQIVQRDQLSRANGRLYAVELTANQFAGPPLGGMLMAFGAIAGFAVPATLWLIAVGALFLVPGKFRIDRLNKTTLRVDIAEGLRFLWHQRILRTLAVMTGMINFASMSIRVSEPHPIVRLSPTGRAEEHQWWCGSAPQVLPVTDYAVARAACSLML